MERRAKIVATLGPASSEPEVLDRLFDAGLDVVRLNFSHGTPDEHRRTIRRVRERAAEHGRHVPVLFDLMGPRYRLAQMTDGPLQLESGRQVVLGPPDSAPDLPIDEGLLPHLQPGERVLIDNGLIELAIERVAADRATARVLTGGRVSTRKGINLPDSSLPFSISKKDREDIALAVEERADFLAISYVGQAADLHAVRGAVEASGGRLPLVAKLERRRAVEHIDEILDAADAVMVARGDLGVEVPLHQVPVLQKKIIASGRRVGKPVLVATQMLESMMDHPRPTRAETSDVANAVFDGADALMLSGETAAGKHPIAAVETMARVILEAEAYQADGGAPAADEAGGDGIRLLPSPSEGAAARGDLDVANAVAGAAVFTARHLGARHIVAFSQGGFTARMIARYRPPNPVLVLTADPRVACRVQLLWGVRSLHVPIEVERHEEVVEVVEQQLREAGLARDGERIVVLMGEPVTGRPLTNLMRVHRIGDLPLGTG